MQTKLPTALTNKEEIENFVADLWKNNELFHLDDSAEDIINAVGEPLFTEDEATKIDLLLKQAFDVCNVWELPIIDSILNEINTDYDSQTNHSADKCD